MNGIAHIRQDYEARIRVLERSLSGEKERARHYGFLNKQLESQVKKLQTDNGALSRELKTVKKCATCSCSDERRKQEDAVGGLLYGLLPRSRSNLSVGAPLDPEQPRQAVQIREVQTLRDANLSLQQCVDNLHKLTKEKAKEAITKEEQFAATLRKRDEQIKELQNELQRRDASQLPKGIQERNQLLSRIRTLEDHLSSLQLSRGRKGSEDGGRVASGSIAGGSASNAANVEQLRREKNALSEHLKKLNDEIEAERLRYAANETLFKKQLDLLSSDYEQVVRRCETLEVELAKRRGDEVERRSTMRGGGAQRMFSSNPADGATEETDLKLTDFLKDELLEAQNKISQLEVELISARRRVITPDSTEIGKLQKDIDDLEIDKRECKRRLYEQEETLRQLEEDIAGLMDEKSYFARKCNELERNHERTLRDNIAHLDTIHKLRVDLSEAERLNSESARTHIAEIEAYQEMLRKKDAERALFIEQLCGEDPAQAALQQVSLPAPAVGNSLYVERSKYDEAKNEVESLNIKIQELIAEADRLQKELRNAEERAVDNERTLEREVALKNSIHDDLANARKLVLEKDAELVEANSRLRTVEVDLSKLKADLANALEQAEAERTSAEAQKAMAEELEELLRDRSDQVVSATLELQRATSDAARLRETIYDLESKLTLQGRDLKDTRSRLADLRTKVRVLGQETHGSSTRSSPRTVERASPVTVTASPSPSPSGS